MFFEMFEGWSQNERKQYLKYVWGRSKIPTNTEDLEYMHELDYGGETNGFPIAHTCFFRLDLPDYDNIDIMR